MAGRSAFTSAGLDGGACVGQFLRAAGWVVLLALCCSTARADAMREIRSGDFTLEIGVRAQANLIYHLDCLARVTNCTRPVFEGLWRDHLGLDAKDRAQLEAWGKLRQQAQAEGGSDLEPSVASPVPLMAGGSSPWDKVRQAGLLAPTPDALERAWGPVLASEVRQAKLSIMAGFRPRFDAWWAQSEGVANAMLPGLEAALHLARGPELLRGAGQFFGAELGDQRMYVHLVVQPNLGSRQSRAELVESHMLVEVQAGEDAADRVPVIVHEMAHHVWSRVPAQRRAMLAREMLQSGRDGAAAWNLFDEVQATVFGNILAGRNVTAPERFQAMRGRPMAFYADDAIDRGARATETLFEQAIHRGVAMDAAFARAFVEALRKDLRGWLDTPVPHLRNAALNVETDESPWVQALAGAVQAWGVWTYSPLGTAGFGSILEQFPGFSAAVFASVDQLHKLEPVSRWLGVTVDQLRQSLAGAQGVAVIAERTPHAVAVIVVARDEAAMGKLVAAVPTCPLKPGVCARVP